MLIFKRVGLQIRHNIKKNRPPNRSAIPRTLEGDSSKPQIVAVSLRGSLAGNNQGSHPKSDSLVNWRL